MSPLWVTFYRTIILYFALIFAVRVMGKREVGNLSPVDLVVTIVIADLAVMAIESPDASILTGLVPLATITLLQILISYTALKTLLVRKIFDGTHTVVIRSGQIDEQALRSNRYTLDELLTHIREAGYPDIGDIEFAILENDGEISIIPKSQKRPLTPADLGIETPYEGMPHVLIKDGEIMYPDLEAMGLSRKWLEKELKKLGYHGGPESIFLAMLNTQGQLFVQEKARR